MAMARVLLAAGVAMVHGVAVVPDVRRQGIGSAITAEALRRVRDDEGYRIARPPGIEHGPRPVRADRLPDRRDATAGTSVRHDRPLRRTSAVDVVPAAAPAAAEARRTPPSVVDAWCFVGPYREREPGTPYELDALLADHHRLGIGARLVLHAESRDGVPTRAMPR